VASPRTSSGAFESEVAFVITNKGDDIAKDVAGLTSILGYDLKPKPTRRIHDTYYDTKRQLLRKRRIALRIRRMHGSLLVSIKSNSQPLKGKGVRRIEFEAPWSQKSLAMIRRTLKTHHANVDPSFSRLQPWNNLASMGLLVIQERITRRVVRDISRHDRPGSMPVAELDIDNVTYPGDPKIRVFEIEIEAKASRSLRRIEEIAEAIQSSYSDFLKVWPYGKLATGMAIQRLLKSGVLQSHLVHGRLTPQAFTVIERSIVSKSPSRL
jgi:hypothetical protein